MRPAFNGGLTLLSKSSCRSQYRCASIAAQISRYQSDNASPKRREFDGYIADKLDAPLWSIRPQTRTQPEPPPPDGSPMTAKEETLAKARVVFGSRLAGPAERREQIDKLSTNVAGIMVPPKPEEPENCCMSGCVNCVWDRYRDELEEWAETSGKARAQLNAQKAAGGMDENGGGSEALRDPLGAGGSDLFADIPVGIREFMKVEKKLKERKRRDAEEQAQAG